MEGDNRTYGGRAMGGGAGPTPVTRVQCWVEQSAWGGLERASSGFMRSKAKIRGL